MFPAAKRQRMDNASGGSRNPDQAPPHAYVLPHASALPAMGGVPEQSYQIHIGTAPPVPDIRALFEAGRYQEAGLAPMSQLFPSTHMPLPRPTRYHPDPIPYGVMIPDNEEMVNAISPDLLKQMFLQLTQEDASGLMYSALVNHYVRQHVAERSRVINFDSYSRTAWHAINTKYDRLSGSKQYERANYVLTDVERCIESISQQATAFSSFGTKVNALETLRRIGKTIISASEIIGREVHRNYEWDMDLKNAITTILRTMSREECFKAGQNVSEVGKGKLWEKMEWVRAEAVNNRCLAGLDVWEACERLRGEDPDEITDSEFEKEDESEGDDQEEEEDEDENQEDYERENEGSTGGDDERSNTSDEDEEPFHPSQFAACADEVEHILYAKYSHLNDRQQHEKSFDAAGEIGVQTALIRELAEATDYGYAKERALDALVDIGNLILMAEGSVVAREIRAQLSHVEIIPELILSIVRSISESDRKAIGKEGRLTEDLIRLVAVAKDRAITVYDCLDQAIEMLS